jgi:hypothetical protein
VASNAPATNFLKPSSRTSTAAVGHCWKCNGGMIGLLAAINDEGERRKINKKRETKAWPGGQAKTVNLF